MSQRNVIKFAEEEDPDNKDVFDLKCQIEDSLARSYETIQECNKILRGEKGNIKILFARGKCYYHIGCLDDYKKSFGDFENILKLNPSHKQALEWISKIKARLRDLKIDVPEIDAFDLEDYESCESESEATDEKVN